jgi:ubiquinone/menaquinone biosynthesis C-methylase UbiE
MTELSGTYVVQDKNNQEELNRLILQDHMVTTTMGGVLPEQKDPSQFRRILDIGCGPGGWILETAQAYPQIRKLYGIDISPTMIRYAQQQAEQQHIPTGPKERVEFLVMDALLILEFPDDFFDLVNLRFGVSFMRQWDWPKMFSEMNRVTRTDGVIRIVEGEIGSSSASEALNQFIELERRALYRAGHLFAESPTGLLDMLPSLLVRNGFTRLEARRCENEYRAGTESGDAMIQDIMLVFRTIRPFLRRYGCEPMNYDAICQQAIKDIQQPNFAITWSLTTMWASNPGETNGFAEINP